MNSDQKIQLDAFVHREVIKLASQLIEDLLEISMYGDKVLGGIELDNIENLYITDEATAKDFGFDSLEAMQESGEDQQEIYEWWFVTQWLYERLKKAGEPVMDSDYGYLWGRTCTGQAISLDRVIQDIYAEMIGRQETANEPPLKNAVRFPKLKNKTLKGKISEYSQNWDKAEAAIKAGRPICLSDLMIQAEDIHLTNQTNTARGSKKD